MRGRRPGHGDGRGAPGLTIRAGGCGVSTVRAQCPIPGGELHERYAAAAATATRTSRVWWRGSATGRHRPGLQLAWKKFSQYAGPLILVTLVVLVGQVILSGIQFAVNRSGDSASAASSSGWCCGASRRSWASPSSTASSGPAWRWWRAVSPPSPRPGTWTLGPFVVAAILRGILVFVGLLLCIIQGLIIWFLTIFTPFYVIDKNLAPTEAIANSIALVRRHAGKLILFCLVAWLVYLLGAIVCFVGLLVSIPVAMVRRPTCTGASRTSRSPRSSRPLAEGQAETQTPARLLSGPAAWLAHHVLVDAVGAVAERQAGCRVGPGQLAAGAVVPECSR